MPRVVYQMQDPLRTAGRNLVIIVPAIEDIEAPTVTELNTGIEVQCAMNGIDWTGAITKNTTTGRDVICQSSETTKPAPQTLGTIQMQFWYDPQASGTGTDQGANLEALLDALAPDTKTFIFDRGGLPYSDAIAASQKGTCAYVQVNGDPVPTAVDTAQDNNYGFTVDLAILAIKTLNSTVATA